MKIMNRFTKTVALMVSMMSCGGMAFSQQCKVAVVNMQEAIAGSSEGKALSRKFDARVGGWKARIDVLQAEFSAAQRKLTAQNGNPNQADIAELNRAVLLKKDELVVATSEAQRDIARYRELLLAPIEKFATEISKAVAAERGIDSVMDSSSPTVSFPINGDATNCDITAEVKKRMNSKRSSAALLK
jgi:Skp family chaperone for outer membrane proteins